MQQYRFINNSNQLNMFRVIISPIFSSSASRLPAGNIVGALYHKL